VPRIDLNADVGESFGRWTLGDDSALLPLVTSANVACGFHAGDPTTLRRTCVDAVQAGVSIGAQVSYRDLAGFGRRFVDVGAADLAADVLYQLGALDGLARAAGSRVRYVKPHGALYHATIAHGAQAGAVLDALEAYDDTLAVVGLPGSLLLADAERRGVRTVTEAFADRAYRSDGTLVDRRESGAVLDDPDVVAERVVRLVQAGTVTAVDGTEVAVRAESVCLHGDTPGAVAMARAVRTALDAAGVEVAAFA
jgi:5-oxoprolinase (ATP-hydrolysing) subunit A